MSKQIFVSRSHAIIYNCIIHDLHNRTTKAPQILIKNQVKVFQFSNLIIKACKFISPHTR